MPLQRADGRGRNRFGILVLNVEVGAVHQAPRSRHGDTVSYTGR